MKKNLNFQCFLPRMRNKFLLSSGKLWLSPMEGVSDLGFRNLCSRRRASLTFTEMIRADGLVRGNNATLSLVDSFDGSVPTGIQLFVTKPDILKKTLAIIRRGIVEKDGRFSNLSVIDLNFGCPSPEIINLGGGPAMLKRTERMKELLTVLRTESPLPCGIKIRLGMNEREKQQKVYLRIVELANEVGLDYLTVHPKVASDDSRVPIDFGALQEIIDYSSVPIVGNGFVVDGSSAKRMLEMGCSAVMIARAAVGNPWVFEEIERYLKTGKEVVLKKDYAATWKEYKSLAERYGTKEKYHDYHKKVFELRGKGDLGFHSPSKILKWV